MSERAGLATTEAQCALQLEVAVYGEQIGWWHMQVCSCTGKSAAVYVHATEELGHSFLEPGCRYRTRLHGKRAKGEELDQRIRCLPPAYGTRHFKNGISALSQVSGSKRKDMARILLGCLVGRIPHALMLTLRALLDFIYIVQYSTHDGQTLKYLEDALVQYHKHKDILKTLSLVHYANSIRSLGTTDNYNTEMFKRLHIDCAKKAWRASNHRNERPQMTKWLEQREKIAMFESLCLLLHTSDADTDEDADAQTPSISTPTSAPPPPPPKTGLFLPKHPSSARQSIHAIANRHCAPGFTKALNQHARPRIGSEPARFDTVVVLHDDNTEATGVQGTRIGRVKVIFKLPDTIHEHGSLNEMHAPEEWATQGPLAYVEWYANLPASADLVHMMYEVCKLPLRTDGTPAGEIIPLSMIRQSYSVLDKAQKFLLNNWASKYSYQTLW
ncbi:hypothetical protein C8Q72DRAFT_796259 [Fomitopsis betulina]|nr:hypothetical protein C8Q72DRAFT_796259 [Fomitopsis betulina]